MRVATWNVNSLRLRLERVADWLRRVDPDVVALQETKVVDDLFPAEALAEAGYQAAFAGEKSYNGVALLAKQPLAGVRVEYPLAENGAKRLISGQIGDTRFYSAYFPNGRSPGTPFYDEKVRWIDALGEMVQREAQQRGVVLLGDYNVAPRPIDVYDPELLESHIHFTPGERATLDRLAERGLSDAFRLIRQEAGQYSWWDYRQGMFRRNLGLRIDHCWVTAQLAARVTDAFIDKPERAKDSASDHAPVVVEFSGEP
ncbi:MAG TPA: exodeoxyribonuclease III [Chloroflexota bacterium]|nr:exodeoxyribonuclease III [Chloroflexota bacterium]